MKKNLKKMSVIILSVFVVIGTLSMCGSLVACSEKNNVHEYFDLTDTKILFDENIVLDAQMEGAVCLDRLVIYLKKAKVYKKLEAKDFRCNNISGIDYYNFEPQQDKLEDIEYMQNFRQKLGISLGGVHNAQQLVTIIKEIETLDFVKEVQIVLAVDDEVPN